MFLLLTFLSFSRILGYNDTLKTNETNPPALSRWYFLLTVRHANKEITHKINTKFKTKEHPRKVFS